MVLRKLGAAARLILCLILCAPALALPATPPVDAALLRPYERFYGLYFDQQKVGYMRMALEAGADIVISTELRATLGGMGKKSSLTLKEIRGYRKADGLLAEIGFLQQAETGRVKVYGKRFGSALHLEVEAGGQASKKEVICQETLADFLAVEQLVRYGKVGENKPIVRFDPAMATMLEGNAQLVKSGQFPLAGIHTPALLVKTSFPSLHIHEESWYLPQGQQLEGRIGNMLTARLEPEEVAKEPVAQVDVLRQAAVGVTKPLAQPTRVQRLTFLASSAEDLQLPADNPFAPWQRQQKTAGGWRITLARPAQLPNTSLQTFRQEVASKQIGDPELAQALAPTPFIQSGHPQLRSAAAQAVGNANTLAEAVERLVHFTYQHMQREYVPAYSNALEAWTTARGDCTEHTVLFVALARAAQIPAREVVGLVYWPPSNGFGWHAWAQIYTPSGWVSVDPTWDQPIADATHWALAHGGPEQQLRVGMLIGRLKIDDLRPTYSADTSPKP